MRRADRSFGRMKVHRPGEYPRLLLAELSRGDFTSSPARSNGNSPGIGPSISAHAPGDRVATRPRRGDRRGARPSSCGCCGRESRRAVQSPRRPGGRSSPLSPWSPAMSQISTPASPPRPQWPSPASTRTIIRFGSPPAALRATLAVVTMVPPVTAIPVPTAGWLTTTMARSAARQLKLGIKAGGGGVLAFMSFSRPENLRPRDRRQDRSTNSSVPRLTAWGAGWEWVVNAGEDPEDSMEGVGAAEQF